MFLYAIKDTPPMCTEPVTKDGLTFACRRCDACIATRRHQWVARAMAEKADWPHTIVLALTYSDETEIGRQGARMFCYADVMGFLKRLRQAAHRAQQGATVRFLCAGEQGDRNGRCHWHMIIYSSVAVTALGAFSGRYGPVNQPSDMISKGKNIKRLNWSLWPYGFVTLQEPDQGRMSYVLSYCLKDQFTCEKSAGKMREAKSENFATGLFRMSKRPAIGENWLMARLDALYASGAVLPRPRLSVPEFRGYWQPSGLMMERLLWGLSAINTLLRWHTGRDAPQWSSLLAECAEIESYMEILNVPNVEEKEEVGNAVLSNARIKFAERETREVARNCGGQVPCRACLDTLDDQILSEIWLLRSENRFGETVYKNTRVGAPEVGQWRSAGRINPYCRKKGEAAQRRAFPRSGG